MPAHSIIKNRHQLRQAREALKGLPPKEREALYWNGIGPGDGYIGFWKTVKYYRQKIAGIERELRNDKLSAETRRAGRHDLRQGDRVRDGEAAVDYAEGRSGQPPSHEPRHGPRSVPSIR
jgi:hypothetical protein